MPDVSGSAVLLAVLHHQFIFDKLSDKKNRLKIALQVTKLGFSPIVMP